jgi:hypothetical protein
MGKEIDREKQFHFYGTLDVVTENRLMKSGAETEKKHFEIYENNRPQEFFAGRIKEHYFKQ